MGKKYVNLPILYNEFVFVELFLCKAVMLNKVSHYIVYVLLFILLYFALF